MILSHLFKSTGTSSTFLNPRKVKTFLGYLAILLLTASSVFFILTYLQILYLIPHKWIHPTCKCSRFFNPDNYFKLKSTCASADFRGPKQKVISYSFYGNVNSSYFKGISRNSKAIAALYPGWSVRLYHNIEPNDKFAMNRLCEEVCSNPILDECYVGDLNEQFPGIKNKFGMLWRFLVLGDPSIEIFGVRDLDSPIYQREVDAVNDWILRNKTWHIMRDNLNHKTHILGGMWGANNSKNVYKLRSIRDTMITSENFWGQSRNYDQQLLSQFVWPEAQKDMVAHDSFLCKFYPGTIPWPTPRVNFTFVGDMEGLFITHLCPEECRPKKHLDWIYC